MEWQSDIQKGDRSNSTTFAENTTERAATAWFSFKAILILLLRTTYYVVFITTSDRMHSDRGLKGLAKAVSHRTTLSAVNFLTSAFLAGCKIIIKSRR